MNNQLTTHENAQLDTFRRRAVRHYNEPYPQIRNAHEAVAYALWQSESARDAKKAHDLLAKKSPMNKRGMVLTDKGWEIPSGPLNPRIIDQSDKLSPFQLAYEDEVQRQVKGFADAHEHVVRVHDIGRFLLLYRTWELPIRFYFEPVNVQ